jgi:hypothetical protein
VDNELLVTNSDGDSLDIYDAQSLELVNQVVLGDDLDNVRYDTTGYAYVGYSTGNGATLGIVDDGRGTKAGDIKLNGHPESFRLEEPSQRIFVNGPTADRIAVVDRENEPWSRCGP